MMSVRRKKESRSMTPSKSDESDGGRKNRSRSPRRSVSSSLSSDSEKSKGASRSKSRSRSPSSLDGYRLHIGDIGEGVTKADLVDVFKKFGPLREFWMANSPPCFGFAVFKHKRDAKEALNGTDGMTIFGSRIRVSMARPRTRGHGRRCFSPSMRCYHCGNSGHFYRDCPEKYDNRYGGSRSRDYRDGGGKFDRYSSRDSRDYRERDRDRGERREHRSRRY